MTDLATVSTADLRAELERRHAGIEPPELLQVITLVSMHFRVPVDYIRSKSRLQEHVIPRQIAVYLCVDATAFKKSATARLFGMNHANVIYAVAKVKRNRQMLAAAMKIRKKI